MFDFIIANWDSVLVVIAFVVFILILIRRGATKQVNEILFYLVTEAESTFGGGTGELKYAAVVAWLYEKLPTIIKLLFTQKQIDLLIENAVLRMKKYLDTNDNAKILILPPKDALDI